jgi:hypothetical protein
MKKYGGVDVKIHVFLTSALVGVCGLLHIPAALPPRERAPGTHWIGGWLGPTVNFNPSAVQPVAIRYIDCAIPAPANSLHNICFNVQFRIHL